MKPPLLLAAATIAVVKSPHISIQDYALLLVAVAYTASLIRDFRPIRALRSENAELRGELEKKDKEMAEKTRQFEVLEGSRDFKAAFNESLRALADARLESSAEHTKIVDGLTAVERGLAANTAALSALAAGIHAGNV